MKLFFFFFLFSITSFALESKEWLRDFLYEHLSPIYLMDKGLLYSVYYHDLENDGGLEYFINNLEDVALSNIEYLPEEIKYLTNLDSLLIFDSNINNLSSLKELKNLNSLYMENSNIDNLSSLKELKNLQNLSIVRYSFSTIPVEIKELNLNTFNMSNCLIENIPNWFYDLNLTSFGFVGDRLSYVDKDVCKLNLNSFSASNNYFDEVPICVKNFKNIKYIPSVWNNVIECSLFENSEECFKAGGWSFYKLQIGYEYLEDNQIIYFYPILGDEYNITSFSWDFGDGNISTLEKPIYEFPNYGDYNVSLTIITKDKNITTSKMISHKERVLKIKKGWNLLSNPTKTDIDIDDFPESFIFWTYEFVKSSKPLLYASDFNWTNPTSIKPSLGFWVNADRDFNYSYSGDNYEFHYESMREGWNLIGSGEKITIDENSTIWDSQIWRSEKITVDWHYKNGVWFQSPIIDIGEGVWIKKEYTSD